MVPEITTQDALAVREMLGRGMKNQPELRQLLPDTGVIWDLSAQSGKKSPKWVLRTSRLVTRPKYPPYRETSAAIPLSHFSCGIADYRCYRGRYAGGKKPNKYKTTFRLVPGTGGGQNCLCIAFFLVEARKHMNKIPRKYQETLGHSQIYFLNVFFVYCLSLGWR